MSAFPDSTTGTTWLFGTDEDRCDHGNRVGKVLASWSKDLARWGGPGDTDAPGHTFNVEEATVPNPPPGLPLHKYVLINGRTTASPF